jgi:uncharacterized membrane protein
MNGKSRETIQRLKHALERLQRDPRNGDRRVAERRVAALVLLPVGQERRSYADRRRLERRTA